MSQNAIDSGRRQFILVQLPEPIGSSGNAVAAQFCLELGLAPTVAEITKERLRLRAYADLFNARQFDALRNLLADDVQLTMPPATRRSGSGVVSHYFARYSEVPILWRMEPAFIDGRPGLVATDPADAGSRFIVLLGWSDGRIVAIRDFFFARYVMDGIHIARI